MRLFPISVSPLYNSHIAGGIPRYLTHISCVGNEPKRNRNWQFLSAQKCRPPPPVKKKKSNLFWPRPERLVRWLCLVGYILVGGYRSVHSIPWRFASNFRKSFLAAIWMQRIFKGHDPDIDLPACPPNYLFSRCQAYSSGCHQSAISTLKVRTARKSP